MGRTQNVERVTLKELEAASKELGRVERKRDEAILRAHMAGNSLRVIAYTTRLSHETVRTIVERMQEWVRFESDLLAKLEGGGAAGMSIDSVIRAEVNHRRRSEHLRKLLNVKISDS
jgi:hypothetical protein